jgi:TonB family protein
MPHAQGGDLGMYQYITKNIIYPQLSKEIGMSGTVYVTFEIDKTGYTRKTRLLRGRYPELDTEALRIISSLPPWTPGFQNGFPVNVQFNIPIKFTLR